ncbi:MULTISPECIES: hypothetical protein [unclassified Pseudomonas]|uniref:hypothetical protein n=1 Tax=unclassified Pseudomonas TaxID=196821 RepID=UPI002360E0C5|nr:MULTISPECIES: hypothetical protein [unclassified Pseudomonas]
MNDEQFEGRMQIVEVEVSQLMANQLRARDNAQREAIKSLESSLAHACVLLGEADYQARLWEDYQTENEMEVEDHWVTSQVRDRIYKFLDSKTAAELLRSTYSSPRLVSWSEQMSTCTLVFKEREYYFDLNDDCKDDDAQAEQQGAQGAQAVDEHESFEAWHRSVVAGDPPHEKYHDGSYVNQHVNRYWTGWSARAALGTQPAEQLWAVHAQGPDDLFAAFSREDAEAHAAGLNALPCPPGISVSAVVIESPWPAAEHWKYLAEMWKYLADKEQESNSRTAAVRGADHE